MCFGDWYKSCTGQESIVVGFRGTGFFEPLLTSRTETDDKFYHPDILITIFPDIL